MAPGPHCVVPDLGGWRIGNTSVEGVWELDSGRPGKNLLITALVHGNEFSGANTLLQLLRAGIRPWRGRLTLAFCNLRAFDAFNPQRPDANRFVDVDLNRVWSPERLAGPPSAEQARANELLPFVVQADWLLDLHSMHEPCAPLLLTGVAPRHLQFSRRLGAPQNVVVDPGHPEGCRLRDFNQFAPNGRDDALSLLLEAGHHFDPQADAIALDVATRFLLLADAVDPAQIPHAWRVPLPATQNEFLVSHAITARSMNFRFCEDYQGLKVIPRKGTVIAHDGDESIVTPYDDCVLVMPSVKQLRPGVTVVRLASRQRVAHGAVPTLD